MRIPTTCAHLLESAGFERLDWSIDPSRVWLQRRGDVLGGIVFERASGGIILGGGAMTFSRFEKTALPRAEEYGGNPAVIEDFARGGASFVIRREDGEWSARVEDRGFGEVTGPEPVVSILPEASQEELDQINADLASGRLSWDDQEYGFVFSSKDPQREAELLEAVALAITTTVALVEDTR